MRYFIAADYPAAHKQKQTHFQALEKDEEGIHSFIPAGKSHRRSSAREVSDRGWTR
jgi:hypothetical protein